MHELFEKLLVIVSNPRFLSGESAGAETPFYICPYAVADAEPMKEMVSQLTKKLAERNVKVILVDAFKLMVEILKANDDYDWTLEHEGEQSFAELRDDLHGVLDEANVIAPAIGRMLADAEGVSPKVVFVTNIGACYPVLRAHTLLNNLPSVVGRTPLVLFFPGEYRQIPGSGATLSLFGKLQGDGYYRAFNILEAQI